MNRKRWLFALLLVPLALAVPLYSAASWRPHAFGVHPFVIPPTSGVNISPELMLSPDGTRLLTFWQSNLAMWDVERQTVLWKSARRAPFNRQPLCFSPDGQTLAVAENPASATPSQPEPKPALVILDAESGQRVAALAINASAEETRIVDAAFSRDGEQITIALDDSVCLWNVNERSEIARDVLLAPDKSELGFGVDIKLAPDGRSFIFQRIFYGTTPSPKLTYTEIRDIEGHKVWGRATDLKILFAFSPDGSALLAENAAGQTEVLQVKTGRARWKKTLAGRDLTPRWLRDGSAVVMIVGKEVQFLDARSGQRLRSVPLVGASDLVLNPDESQIYSINADGQIARQRLR